MPLVKSVLKEGIKGLAKSMLSIEDKDAALEAYADGLATLIDAYIKTATVVIPPIPVQVVPLTGTGSTIPTTGTLT